MSSFLCLGSRAERKILLLLLLLLLLVVVVVVVVVVVALLLLLSLLSLLSLLLLLANVRFTFLEENTYYIWQQVSLVSWQKPKKLGFEHPQAQPVLS